jgi:hypothetical protein
VKRTVKPAAMDVSSRALGHLERHRHRGHHAGHAVVRHDEALS